MGQIPDTLRAAIAQAAAAADIVLSAGEIQGLAGHVAMVYEANRALNLTAVPIADAPVLHVVDSLRGLEAMRRGGGGPWADLGAGAGFPGVPLCICGHGHVDLVESTGKKARFLDTVKADLCLDATVRAIRAEDAARETPGIYAAIAVRAVGALPELVELASPLLRPDGVLVAWKGALTPEETRRGEGAARIVGLALSELTEYTLPGSEARRALAVFAKTGAATVPLPRRAGLARQRPLA